MYVPENLFIDLETIPSGSYPEVVLSPKPTLQDVKVGNRKGDNAIIYAQEKLPDAISKWEDESEKLQLKAKEGYLKRAVHSLTCEVICLGYAFDKHPPEVITGTEQEIIQAFNALINRFGDRKYAINIVGHNIIGFDLPIIFHRSIKFSQVSLMRFLSGFKDYQGKEHIKDTMLMWAYLTYKEFTKLDDVCKYLGLRGKGDVDGSQVFDLYMQGKLEQICDYCKDDIDQVRDLYFRMVMEGVKVKTA